MELIVCLKQVPDTEAQIKIGADGKAIDEKELKWVMNPYDEFGVEEALRIKEAKGGAVTVISLGGTRATETLRTALAMGADKAVLIDDPAALGGDALTTARVLAAAIKRLPSFDLIFCGQRAVDDDRGIVGQALAEFLGVPHVSLVTKVELVDGGVKVGRPVEGQTLVIKSSLPAVLTAQKGLNEPRYASLPGIMKAKKKPLEVRKLSDLGVDPAQAGQAGSKLKILKLTPPPQRKAGRVVDGQTPQEKAAKLADLLHNEAKVI